MNMVIEKIEHDIKATMKAKEAEKLEALRAIKNALDDSKKRNADGYTEAQEFIILQKLSKERQEAMDFATKAHRADLYSMNHYAQEIIKEYLPQPLSRKELEEYTRTYITEGAFVMKDMGLIIKNINGTFPGRVNGAEVSSLVKEILNEPREH